MNNEYELTTESRIRVQWVPLILLFMFTFILTTFGLYQIVNILWLIFCAIFYFSNKKLLYLLYIIVLPTNGIIGNQYSLFGFIHTLYITNLFTFLRLINDTQYIRHKMSLQLSPNKKILRNIIIVLLLILFLKTLRGDYLNDLIPLSLLLTRTMRFIVQFLPLIMLLRLTSIPKYKSLIGTGFLISSLLISLSIIFSNQLYLLGFSSFYGERFSDELSWRSSGFFGFFGNVNGAGAFLSFSSAYALFLLIRSRKKVLLTILLFIFLYGLFHTGSRSAIMGFLLFTIGLILLHNIRTQRKFLLILILLIIFVVLVQFHFFIRSVERFEEFADRQAGGNLDPNNVYARLGGWIFYLEYIFDDPEIILFGTYDSLYEESGIGKHRDAHNFHIGTLYNCGIFFLIYIFYLYYRFLKFNSPRTIYFFLFLSLFFITNGGGSYAGFLGFYLFITATESSILKNAEVNREIAYRDFPNGRISC